MTEPGPNTPPNPIIPSEVEGRTIPKPGGPSTSLGMTGSRTMAMPAPAPARMRALRTLGLAMAATIFVLDQLVKWLVTGPLGIRASGDTREILPFFDLSFVANYGISLGLFPANSATATYAIVLVTLAISAGVAVWLWREETRGDVLALGAVLGGALGNIVDRVRFGYVVDYADLHFGTVRPFLVFNVADAAISIGAVVLVLRAFLIKREKPATETHDA